MLNPLFSFPVPTALNVFIELVCFITLLNYSFSLTCFLFYLPTSSGIRTRYILFATISATHFPIRILYMVFGSGFNPIYGLWVRFPCPNCVESHIWSLSPVSIPYMVFGSGFPVPTVQVESYIWSLGPVSLSYCVESHIWSLGPVSLSYCVESHIWSLGLVSLSQLC